MAEPRFVRILARWRDDRQVSPMTLDAPLGPDHRILGRGPLFGAMSAGEPERRPFILDGDTLDFGVGAAEPWRSDLRACVVAVGARFTVEWPGGDVGFYEIEKVATLGAKGAGPPS